MAEKPVTIAGRSKGVTFYRRRVDPRVQLHGPKDETFPIPLKYIDVTTTAHATLDVLQESRIDDDWKIDVNRNLSEPWTRFTEFTLLIEKILKVLCGTEGG